MKELVLASASKYRRELLSRLGLPFVSMTPLIDEEKEKDPTLKPLELAEHLAKLKAQSLANSKRVVIGGDQLVAFNNEILGKAHTAENAIKQLLKMQGQSHQLITAVCIATENQIIPFTNITTLKMKKLSREQIEHYVKLDNPIDCAGSYKIELHGINLFEKIDTTDFTAIQGLPLIELSQKLNSLGFGVFGI